MYTDLAGFMLLSTVSGSRTSQGSHCQTHTCTGQMLQQIHWGMLQDVCDYSPRDRTRHVSHKSEEIRTKTDIIGNFTYNRRSKCSLVTSSRNTVSLYIHLLLDLIQVQYKLELGMWYIQAEKQAPDCLSRLITILGVCPHQKTGRCISIYQYIW